MYHFIRNALPLILLVATPAYAQLDLPLPLDMPLPGVTRYSEDIPRPEDVIGHQIGTRHTEPHQVVEYFRWVASVSDRVILNEHARSYEGRPLIHAVVTSPANHARLDEIRRANLRLSDDPDAVPDPALAGMPAVVYMGYSIHGNEASGTEAGILLLYHLAAGAGQSVERVLDDVVVILDPMLNPDGRSRFTTWANRNRGAVPVSDPQNREHNEPWPGGRTNHYWFDLNRDWLPLAHPESRGRLELFHHWRPQVLTDFHEMEGDATYFFQPGIPSRNNPNTPEATFDLTAEIATYHARALDRIGSLYYTKESFDDFYYGKGSTYPDINGAVGILFEQASSRALERDTENGLLTYAFTVRNQFTTSLSTLEAAVEMREKLLRHQRDFYASAPSFARHNPVTAYVIGIGDDRTRGQMLAEILIRHRIRVHELARDLADGGRTFRAGEAYVIPIDQPQARLVKAIMERTTTFSDSLFYDISTWTLPLAFGLEYAELGRVPAGSVGAEILNADLEGGRLIGGRSPYGYLMTWGRYFSPRALYRLQRAGVRPRLIQEPVTTSTGASLSRGTIFIPVVQENAAQEEVHKLVEQIVSEEHVDVHAVRTGLTVDGPDLGSRGSKVLDMPRVALITGSGVNSADAGEAWFLLSERFRMGVSLVEADELRSADLSRYNTIVLPGTPSAPLPAEKIRSWVQDGGRLIALPSAAGWAVDQGFAPLEKKESDLDSLVRHQSFEALALARGAQRIGGSIFEARVDPTHPLAYGYGDRVPFFRRGTTFYNPSSEPGTNVAVYADEPLLSGYIAAPMLEQARGSAALVARRLGRGSVILFMDNPNFRAFWHGTNGFFLNAVFLGGAI